LPDESAGTAAPVRDEHGSRRSAFSGGVWSAGSTVAPMALALALSVVISRELGAEVLGQQSLVAYVASLMFSVAIYSFTSASVQLLSSARGARDEARLAHLSRWSFAAHLVGGGLAATLLLVTGLARTEYQALWFLAAVTALVDSVGWAYASRDIALNGWRRTASRRLPAQALGPALGIVAVYAGLGVQGVFAAQLVVALGLTLVLRRLGRTAEAPAPSDLPAPPWRPVLRLWSLFALSTIIVQVVERRLELVFLDQLHDPETVAMFSVAFNVVGLPLLLSASLIGAAMPAIARRHAEDPQVVVATLSRAARVLVAANLVLCAGTVTVGPGLVVAVYGADFGEAAGLVRYLGLTLLLAPLGHLCTALWTGTGRLRPVLVAGATGAVVDLVLAVALIPRFAAEGAAVATIAAQTTVAAIVIGYTFRRGLRLQLRPGRLLRAAVVAVAAGAAATACAVLLGGWLGTLLSVPAFALVVVLGSRFVGVVDPEDVDWLATTLPAKVERIVRAVTRPPRQPVAAP
jgi:O-antigen/teichoic acid export membrane protein